MYRACWPVQDLLQSRLKNTSTRWRRKQRDMAADNLIENVARLNSKGVSKVGRKKVYLKFHLSYAHVLTSIFLV